jgi:hypothetical protein
MTEEAQSPRLLEQVREVMRLKHFSLKTEKLHSRFQHIEQQTSPIVKSENNNCATRAAIAYVLGLNLILKLIPFINIYLTSNNSFNLPPNHHSQLSCRILRIRGNSRRCQIKR